MVFSKLLDNLKGILSPNANKNASVNNQSINQEIVNELQQGMELLNNRKQQVDKLKSRMNLIENLSGFTQGKQTLKGVSDKELQVLQQLEQEYNRKLSAYSTNYKTFMGEYQKGVEDVKKCKANCITSIPRSGAWSYKRQACNAGCDLKGPFVQKCEDTFLKSRVGSQDCNSATKGRCLDGQVVLGQEGTVTSSNYADSNNVTIKDGCCDCGGGSGGPPSTMMRGKKITKCEQIPEAYGYTAAAGGYMTTSCYNARVESENNNKNLHTKYTALAAENQELIDTAQKIFDKIKELGTTDMTIQKNIDDTDFDVQNKLAEYGSLYADVIARQGKKDRTIDGQLEDVRYKEQSSELQLLIWSGLAILTILLVIQRMRK